MIWLVAICGVMLTISAVLVLYRIEKGPSTIDRVVSVDVMTSILLGALALLAAMTRRSDLLAVFVVVSVIGFLGSVAIARAAKREDPGNRRILTLEEERAAREAEEAVEEEAEEVVVHDVDVAEVPTESANSALWFEPNNSSAHDNSEHLDEDTGDKPVVLDETSDDVNDERLPDNSTDAGNKDSGKTKEVIQ